MYENREQRRHSKCRDNAEKFLYRPRCNWTGDDTGTVFGICVSLLVRVGRHSRLHHRCQPVDHASTSFGSIGGLLEDASLPLMPHRAPINCAIQGQARAVADRSTQEDFPVLILGTQFGPSTSYRYSNPQVPFHEPRHGPGYRIPCRIA
jgi:hypothetical protein